MSHTPHELAEEFPQAVQQMHDLRAANAHFAKLCDNTMILIAPFTALKLT